MTTPQVAEFLGVQPSTVRSWVFRRQVPYIKINNGVVRFDREQILEWVEKQRRPEIDETTLASRIAD